MVACARVCAFRCCAATRYYLNTFFLDFENVHDFVGVMRNAIASFMTFDEAGTTQSPQVINLVEPTNLYADNIGNAGE